MNSIPNNIRFRFNQENRDAQVIVHINDFNKSIKKLSKQCNISKHDAKNVMLRVYYDEIVRVYGVPDNFTLLIDTSKISVH